MQQNDQPVLCGVIGCGKISSAYFGGCGGFDKIVKIVACADINKEAAKAKAQQYNIAKVYSVKKILSDPDVQIIINLTIPQAHAKINLAAIKAGKHAYTEKPFALTYKEGTRVLEAAKAKGVLVGSAPDTFLGGGIQTCRKLIDDGAIGKPIAATAFMLNRGHEGWHPNPEFYYKAGGGPMFDMGPYYLTALVNLLGPIKRVTGSTSMSFAERIIKSQPKAGTKITVEVPTHYAGVMDFENGVVGTIIQSFDVLKHSLPRIEIYGTEGSLSVPDPNTFKGPVRLHKIGGDWTDIPLTHSDTVSRGIGVADMAYSLKTGRIHRANGELACHVQEALCAFEKSSTTGKHVVLKSTCQKPKALPMGLNPGELDD